MTQLSNEELDKIIAEIKPEIIEQPESTKRFFTTFDEFKKYFDNERIFWKQFQDRRPYNTFNETCSFIHSAEQSQERNQAKNFLLQAVGQANQKINIRIYSRTARALFLQSLWTQNQDIAKSAFFYLVGQNFENLSIYHSFEGALRGFHHKHTELFSDELNAEKAAFEALRSEMVETQYSRKSEYRKFSEDITSWSDSTKAQAANLLDEKRSMFDKSHEEWIQKFGKAFESSMENIKQLEALYNEKLRLAGPAQYWVDFEKDYLIKGRIWVGLAALSNLLLVLFVGFVLYNPPEILNLKEITLAGTKGAVMLAAALSGMIYMIHLCVRFAVSAFHLARDAKERHQLTHLFLALVKEKVVEPKEREIILQALFSRADTGLLKGDGSPSMPTALGNINEVIRR
jgi:hypothetical protein